MPLYGEPPLLLSDVLGSIVSSMAQARQIADISTVNLAYAYQRNELLRGMAVPRLRFRSIEVDMPVLVKRIQGTKAVRLAEVEDIARGVTSEVIRRALLAADKMDFDSALQNLTDEKTDLFHWYAIFWHAVAKQDEGQVNIFQAQIVTQIQSRVFDYLDLRDCTAPSFESSIRNEVGFAARISVIQTLHKLFFEYVKPKANSNTYEKPYPPPSYEQLKQNSAYKKIITAAFDMAADTCIVQSTDAYGLELEVCTDEVKTTGGQSDIVTRLRFSLREEGMEWVEDERGSRLMVE